jgi:Xaa-Pro dipeptidase
MTDGVQPITQVERDARIEKARKLMHENGLRAIVCEGGSSMFYFTGVRWDPIGFPLVLILPAEGKPVWVADRQQAARLHGLLAPGSELRTWTDDSARGKTVAQALADLSAGLGPIGMEERARFLVFDAIRKAAPQAQIASADPVTAGCRMIKSSAEIALLQRANMITLAAYRAAFATLTEGMTEVELKAIIAAAYQALGVEGSASVMFGQYTAYPHGSVQPQKLREGDLVLMDDGCSLEGYKSDVTRTAIFGKPTPRQREVWSLERKAQDAALAAAQPGATCESVDAAARKVIVDAGFGPGFRLPGLPHRTGHGIGLDIHEWTYLVPGNRTRIQPGMCFSDEPTISIYGEFGVRLEDCMHITEDGARMFTPQSPAIDRPFA